MRTIVILPLMIISLIACDHQRDPLSPSLAVKNFSESQYSKKIIEDFYLKKIQNISHLSESLKKKSIECQALEKKSLEKNWSDMKVIWQKAMMDFHQLEVLNLGPLHQGETTLSQKIYSWPSTNTCRIDGEVLKLKGNKNSFTLSTKKSLIGLDTLEYLLFEPKLVHSCPQLSEDFEKLNTWQQQAPTKRKKDRCFYIEKLSQQLKEHSLSAVNEIHQDKSKWIKQISIQKVYESIVTFADKTLKDKKLGGVSGANESLCPFTKCPQTAEHLLSGLGVEALKANYQGLSALFHGPSQSINELLTSTTVSRSQGFGLYVLLKIRGFEELANQMSKQLTEAHQQLNKQSQKDLFALSQKHQDKACDINNPQADPICQAYFWSKSISDSFKVDLRLALTLSRAVQVEGDVD